MQRFPDSSLPPALTRVQNGPAFAHVITRGPGSQGVQHSYRHAHWVYRTLLVRSSPFKRAEEKSCQRGRKKALRSIRLMTTRNRSVTSTRTIEVYTRYTSRTTLERADFELSSPRTTSSAPWRSSRCTQLSSFIFAASPGRARRRRGWRTFSRFYNTHTRTHATHAQSRTMVPMSAQYAGPTDPTLRARSSRPK